MFTTTELVRDEAWFTNNLDITDAHIDWYILQAEWEVVSYIANIFDITEFSWSNFTNSQAEAFLQRIETLLASWYLLIREYWLEWKDTNSDWYIRCKEARDMLNKIWSWDINLFKTDYTSFTRTAISIGWFITMSTPDDNTSLTPTFTTEDKF